VGSANRHRGLTRRALRTPPGSTEPLSQPAAAGRSAVMGVGSRRWPACTTPTDTALTTILGAGSGNLRSAVPSVMGW